MDPNLRSGGAPADLTGLSLEELYNLDVIQLNVIGGHTHPAGQKMVGYEFMFMDLDGHRDGTDHVGVSQILKDFHFPAASTGMIMEEHMVELMYAPTDKLTLMAMLPVKHMEMDMKAPGNPINQRRFTEVSDGIGDLEILALYTLMGSVTRGHRLILNTGMGFPTGSIDEGETTKSGKTSRFEYNMQLGSGTFDLMPGLTYLGESKKWAWGGQGLTAVRLGRNGNGYRYGNQYQLMAWLGYAVTDWFAPSLRVDGRIWGNVHGADPAIDPKFDPEGDSHRQGGRRVDLLAGTNFYVPSGVLKGVRLSLEAGVPVYESLNGPQLSTRWLFSAGLTYSF